MIEVRNEDIMSADNSAGASGEAQAANLRGFAALDPALSREVARQGGRAAHAMGRAHKFTSEEARRARYARGKSSLAISPQSP